MSERTTILPTLTIEGFVESRDIIINRLFMYYKSANYSQTNMYYTRIKSLRYTLKRYNGDLDKLKDAISEDLNFLYKKYFDTVEVDIQDLETDGGVQLDINITCSYKGRKYLLSKSINVRDVDSQIKDYEE